MSDRHTPDVLFTAADAPTANGRRPQPGDREWTFTFTLDDGRVLGVRIGRTGHAAFLAMLHQEMHDDEWEDSLNEHDPCLTTVAALPPPPDGKLWCLLRNVSRQPCRHCGEVLPYYGAASQGIVKGNNDPLALRDDPLCARHLPIVFAETIVVDDPWYDPLDLAPDATVYVPLLADRDFSPPQEV